ncbi:metallophosphoesterase family protein [Numidum massiliense]|uniref:metallophosphoesterase family protein n=1 Tax=Numidum massiliense TaxID=1522315 RepID=UPI0006D5A258|nr:metallophosphoesterase family protein [Numidum massiliense]
MSNETTRILAISDIHGQYNMLTRLLNKVKYRPETDKLVFLGDYIDRGKCSKEVVATVKRLVEEDGAIAIRGNHDQILLSMLDDDWSWNNWVINGGMATLESYLGRTVTAEDDVANHLQAMREQYHDHLDFLASLPLYWEDERHIFIHAGIDPELDDWRQTPAKTMLWIREKFYRAQLDTGKTVVFGHTPTAKLHVMRASIGVCGEDDMHRLNGRGGLHGLERLNGRDGLHGIERINGRDGSHGVNRINGRDGSHGVNRINDKDGTHGVHEVGGRDDLREVEEMFAPWFERDNSGAFTKIGIDGGAAYGRQLNCLIITGGTYDYVYVTNDVNGASGDSLEAVRTITSSIR